VFLGRADDTQDNDTLFEYLENPKKVSLTNFSALQISPGFGSWKDRHAADHSIFMIHDEWHLASGTDQSDSRQSMIDG